MHFARSCLNSRGPYCLLSTVFGELRPISFSYVFDRGCLCTSFDPPPMVAGHIASIRPFSFDRECCALRSIAATTIAGHIASIRLFSGDFAPSCIHILLIAGVNTLRSIRALKIAGVMSLRSICALRSREFIPVRPFSGNSDPDARRRDSMFPHAAKQLEITRSAATLASEQ